MIYDYDFLIENDFEFTEEEYNRIYQKYNRGIYTDTEWSSYCVGMLNHLMKLNKKVLDNLKEM